MKQTLNPVKSATTSTRRSSKSGDNSSLQDLEELFLDDSLQDLADYHHFYETDPEHCYFN